MSFDFNKLVNSVSDDMVVEASMDVLFDQIPDAERTLRLNVGLLHMMHGWRDTAVIVALIRIAISIAVGTATKFGFEKESAFKLIRLVVDSSEKSLQK